MQMKSFTLIELLITIIIIGVLAVITFSQFGIFQEPNFDKEARADLISIIAAEKNYRIDTGVFYQSPAGQPAAINAINTNLGLGLPAGAERSWNYSAVADNNACCARAQRFNGPNNRTWRMRNTESSPVSGTCP